MSTEVQSVVKVESTLDAATRRAKRSTVNLTNTTYKKSKQEDGNNKSVKFRKRTQSFPGGGGKLFPPYKKRKKEKLILPTKFLLGGNIRDPLNLNSFQDEEVNRAMNAVTPESSPLPTPQHRKGEIEVIIPPDIRDPLSLTAAVEDDCAYVASFSVAKRVKKNKKKKKSKSSSGSGKEDNGDIRSDESKGEEVIETDLKIEEVLPVAQMDFKSDEIEKVIEDKEIIKTSIEEVEKIEKENLTKPPSVAIITESSGVTSTTTTMTTNVASTTTTTTTITSTTTTSTVKRPCNLSDRPLSIIGIGQTSTITPASITVGSPAVLSNNQNVCNTPTSTKVPRKFDNKDKIVSPVVPQPGGWLDRHHHARFRKQSSSGSNSSAIGGGNVGGGGGGVNASTTVPPSLAVTAGTTGDEPTNIQTPKFKEANKKFQYGNYHRYYGYRNASEEDARLRLITQRLGLAFFNGKDVLDVGCNSGLITLSVAKDLGAKHVIGMDIDKSLIKVAKNSLARYSQTMGNKGGSGGSGTGSAGNSGLKQNDVFPLSMPVVFGSLNVPGVKDSTFPRNITFIQGNYVLENDVLLDLETPQFDIILCLSVTKWIHLNWGDDGIKRVFKRMYAQLRPGGALILEPQSWTSYKKKKNLTETTWKNYQNIKLLPSNFTEYLLTEVGFSKCEAIGSPYHPSKGFQRPLKQFTKGKLNSPKSISSSSSTPSSQPQTVTTNLSPKIDCVDNNIKVNEEIQSLNNTQQNEINMEIVLNEENLEKSKISEQR